MSTNVEAGRKRTVIDRENNNKTISKDTELIRPKEDDYSSSDSSSDSSSSGSSSSSSSSSSTSGEGALENDVFDEDDFGSFLPVKCAENEAKFYLKRFARGSVGKCILFKGRWITPNEFQAVSGRKSSKDWKRSIRTKGRILKEYITQGLFQEHAKSCICKICLGENVDMLKQEGEMALAVKRRRLSQADSHTHSDVTTANNTSTTPTTTTVTNSVSSSRGGGTNEVAKRPRKAPVKLEPPPDHKESPSKVWSPSGEVTPDESMDDKLGRDQGTPHTGSSVVDSSDFLPRRSRRTTTRKNDGHRTELGTFTRKPSEWDTEEVSQFLKMQGYGVYSEPFINNEIDGQSLFLLREQHLMERFQMKLGPALSLINIIGRLRHPPTANAN